jgi:hypothetical protein
MPTSLVLLLPDYANKAKEFADIVRLLLHEIAFP